MGNLSLGTDKSQVSHRGGAAHQSFPPESGRSGDAAAAWTRGRRGLSRGLSKARSFLTLIHAVPRLKEQSNNTQLLGLGVRVRRWS